MRTLAFTMWQNDLVGLDLWLKYYRREFDDVYIICFNTNPKYYPDLKMRELKYEVLEGEGWDDPQRTNQMLRDRQSRFIKEYDWVLYCNLDEFLIPDPNKYKSIKNLLEKTKKEWIASECFEVIQSENEPPIDYSKSYLRQRINWVKNPHMNKILLAKVPLSWNDGQHQIDEIDADHSKGFHNTGLYLIHIKHADLQAKGRDFGPMKRSPDNYVSDRSKDSRILIPEEFRDKI